MKVLESSTLKFVIMYLKFLSLFGNGKVYSLKRGYWANALKPTKKISLDIRWALGWDVALRSNHSYVFIKLIFFIFLL